MGNSFANANNNNNSKKAFNQTGPAATISHH